MCHLHYSHILHQCALTDCHRIGHLQRHSSDGMTAHWLTLTGLWQQSHATCICMQKCCGSRQAGSNLAEHAGHVVGDCHQHKNASMRVQESKHAVLQLLNACNGSGDRYNSISQSSLRGFQRMQCNCANGKETPSPLSASISSAALRSLAAVLPLRCPARLLPKAHSLKRRTTLSGGSGSCRSISRDKNASSADTSNTWSTVACKGSAKACCDLPHTLSSLQCCPYL
jgi:hypothetical protein